MSGKVPVKQKRIETACQISCILGEGPVWDHRNNRIFWVDIIRGEIHWLYPETGKHSFCKTGQLIGAITLTNSESILAALQTGFAMVDIKDGSVQPIIDPEVHLPENRFNDGKSDAAGRFWAGTMSLSGKEKAGSLYALEPDFGVSMKLSGVTTSNGMAWSPDNSIFYYIDTRTRRVAAYDYEITGGHLTNQRIVIEIPTEEGYPDGMAIDTEGMLWIALWDGWKIGRWNPHNGDLLETISLPVARPTSCVFGGRELNDLYITSARYGLGEEELRNQPLAGSLFVLKNSGCKGELANEFNLSI
jgi:sugar lactone lactonase YvrE